MLTLLLLLLLIGAAYVSFRKYTQTGGCSCGGAHCQADPKPANKNSPPT